MSLHYSIEDYIQKYFNGLIIKKPLFYNYKYGIRFELGGNLDGNKRIEKAISRSRKLLNEMNEQSDNIFIVVFGDIWEGESIEKDLMKIAEKYIINISFDQVHISEIPNRYPEDLEDDFDIKTLRVSVKTKFKNIRIDEYIKTKISEELNGEVYLINATKNVIFDLYDDRGIDIIASEKKTLRPIYIKYNDWILEWDRQKIDHIFKDESIIEDKNQFLDISEIDCQEKWIIQSAEEFVCLRESNQPLEYNKAAWGEAPINVWNDVIKNFPHMNFWVAQNKTVPIEILKVLSNDEDWRVRDMVASKNKITEELQLKLANDTNSLVRKSVACNKKVTLKTLMLLAKDNDEEIKNIAIKRINKNHYKL